MGRFGSITKCLFWEFGLVLLGLFYKRIANLSRSQ
jgi:hypothetical protein